MRPSPQTTVRHSDALILGASASGLAVGQALARAGRRATVVDRADASGSLMQVLSDRGRPLYVAGRGVCDAQGKDGPAMRAAHDILEGGGDLRMGERLETLTWDLCARLWTATVRTEANEPAQLCAEHLVSAIAVGELTAALKPAPLSRLHARRLRHRARVTAVLLGARVADLPERLEVHDESARVAGVRALRAWPAGTTAADGRPCYGLDYDCLEGDGLWRLDDAALVALAKAELEQIGLADAGDVAEAAVFRTAKAAPLVDEEYEHNMKMVRLDLERTYPTLHLVGQGGLHRCLSGDAAERIASLTADNILAGRRTHDVWAVDPSQGVKARRGRSAA